jgi:uncharacterized membrane protein YeiH
MHSVLEHLGVAVAAVTGVLAAKGKRVDLFGVLVLALVTAFGGGTIRDLTLGDTPVFWVRDSSFALTASITAFITFFVARSREFPTNFLMIADAAALAFFTMLGARKALAFGVDSHIAITMGVITGVAGGMWRDVLIGQIPHVFRRDIFLYATAAIFGALVFVILEKWRPGAPENLPIGAAITLTLRLIGIRWRISLPVFDDPREE